MTNTTEDMTTIQITTHHENEQKQIQQVQVETCLIKTISLFNDLLQCMSDSCDKVIPFPAEYYDIH